MKDPNCPLCRLVFDNEVKTKIIYKDMIMTITYCETHRDQPLVVLNDHRELPNPIEMNQIRYICEKLFPNKKFRGYMQSIPNHWHDHLI